MNTTLPDPRISERFEELITHGTYAFPCACYTNDYMKNVVPWHWHEEFEMSVLEQGACIRYAGDQRYELKAGEGIFIHSGVLHYAETLPGEVTTLGKDIVFHGRLVSGSAGSIFYQKYMKPLFSEHLTTCIVLKPEIPWQNDILDAIRQIHELYQTKEEGYEFQIRNELSSIILLLYKNCNSSASAQKNNSSRKHIYLKSMLRYIHEHFHETITVSDIANCAHICERECLRIFQEIIGESPLQYVIRHRLLFASRLLSNVNLSISEIAELCGFGSTSYFSKMFKRTFGCSPREYRNQPR